MSELPGVGTIHVGGGPVGRTLAPNVLGVMERGRPATAGNLRAARQHFPEGRLKDFERRDDGLLLDKATGVLFEATGFDPLLGVGDPATSGVSCFVVDEAERVAFLRPVGSLAELEAEAAQAEAAENERARALRDFRARQEQVELPDPDFPTTVKAAALAILELGGEISRDGGRLRVTVPAALQPPTEALYATAETAARDGALRAARTLVAAQAVVLEAVDALAADTSKRPRGLAERLPDLRPSVGGGAAG